MNDMTKVIVPKSDQMNSDDLISGPRTIRITNMKVSPGTEQPVAVSFEGDEGKPWKPCKSMSRVLVSAWGPDANVYIGRSATLYLDQNVTWAGMKVGGVRISHLSHIEREMLIALTATKGKKVIAKIQPLKVEQQQQRQPDPNAAANWANEHMAMLGQIDSLDGLNAHIEAGAKAVAKLKTARPDLYDKVGEAYEVRRDMLTPEEGKPDSEKGEGFSGADDEEVGF